jgi:hypothetical protein
MENIELKTPLRVPKRYRKGKKRTEETKVEEFLSMGSSYYFQYDDEESDHIESNKKDSIRAERSIEEFLTSKNIFLTPVSKKKEDFYEAKRERVNSISFFDNEAEQFSSDDTRLNRSRMNTTQSLCLTPGNAKIAQKRNDLTTLSDLKISQLSNSTPFPSLQEEGQKKSKFQQLHLQATLSLTLRNPTPPVDEEHKSYSEDYSPTNNL